MEATSGHRRHSGRRQTVSHYAVGELYSVPFSTQVLLAVEATKRRKQHGGRGKSHSHRPCRTMCIDGNDCGSRQCCWQTKKEGGMCLPRTSSKSRHSACVFVAKQPVLLTDEEGMGNVPAALLQ